MADETYDQLSAPQEWDPYVVEDAFRARDPNPFNVPVRPPAYRPGAFGDVRFNPEDTPFVGFGRPEDKSYGAVHDLYTRGNQLARRYLGPGFNEAANKISTVGTMLAPGSGEQAAMEDTIRTKEALEEGKTGEAAKHGAAGLLNATVGSIPGGAILSKAALAMAGMGSLRGRQPIAPNQPPATPPGIGHNQGPPLGPVPPGPPAGGLPPQGPGALPPISPRQIIHGHSDDRPLTFDDLYTKTIDDLNPIRTLQKRVEEHGALAPDEHFYELARLTRGAYGRTQQAIKHATFDFNTLRNNGASLEQVLKPVRGDLHDFEDFAVAMRDIELHGRGINPGRSIPEAQQIIARAPPEYRSTLNDLHAYQDRIIQYLADSGMLSPQALANIRAANKQYVPFNRITDQQMGDIMSSPGDIRAWQPIRAIKGSNRDIKSPLETIVLNTHKFIDIAEKNRALNALVDAADRRGLTGLVEPVQYHPGQRVADDEIKVWKNGVPSFYRVDSEVARAVNGMGRKEIDTIMDWVSTPARTLRAGAVLTPEFQIKNMGRDQLSAAIFSKNGFIPIADYVRGLGHMIGRTEHYQNWLKSGGANSNYVTLERKYLDDMLQGMKDTSWYQKLSDPIYHPIKFLEKMSEFSEQPTRIGEFVRAQKRGKTIHESGFDAREVSVDFGRRGAAQIVRNMSDATAFFNPTIQGGDKLARAFKENPYRTAFKIGAYIGMPTLLAYAYNRSDPRMKDIPKQERYTYWHFPTDDWQPISQDEIKQMQKQGGMGPLAKDYSNWIKTKDGQTYINRGTIYRAPKPFEAGIALSGAIESTLDAYFMKWPDAFKGFQKSLMSAALPPFLPQAILAPVEGTSNYKFFTESPLVPKRLHSPKNRSYEYTPFTTETAKIVGNAISMVAPTSQFASPMVLENYVQNWSGSLGRYTLQILDAAIEGGARLGAKVAGHERKPKISPEWNEADYPGWRAFVTRMPSTAAQPVRDFYENVESSTTINALMKRIARSGEYETPAERQAAQKEVTRDAFPVKMAKTGIAVNRMFRAMELINQSREISAADKRKMLDMMSLNIMYATTQANEAFRKAQEQNRNGNARP